MMQQFVFENNAVIRTELINDEPWFLAKDLCDVLGYVNPWDALANHVTKDDLAKHEVIDKLGRKQQVNFVNESGLYCLIFGSRLSAAQKFKHWVTSEVLPALRKTGTYTMPQAASAQTAVCPCSGAEYREELYTMRCSLMDMRSCKSESRARSQGTTAALKMVTQLLSRADTDEVLKDWLAFINNVQLMGNIRRSIRTAFLHSFLAVFRASLKEQEHGCALSEQIAAVWEEFKTLERDPHTQRTDLVTAARSLRQILDLA